MNQKQTGKVICTAILLFLAWLLVMVVFHLGLIHGSWIQILGGWLTLLICIVLLFKAGQRIYRKNDQVSLASMELNTTSQIEKALRETKPKAFRKELRQLEQQVSRLSTKEKQLDTLLQDYFQSTSITYSKFSQTIALARQVFAENTRKILIRIHLFDEEKYNELHRNHQEYDEQLMKPYRESFQFVQDLLKENEKILDRLDLLSLKMSELEHSQTPVEELPEMQELNQLIEQTKYYRH